MFGIWPNYQISKEIKPNNENFQKFQFSSNILFLESKIWGPWTTWTPCTATCGTGMTMRSRNCVGNRKLCSNNDAIMQKTCNTQSCQFSLSFWSSWSDWTECR